MGKLIYLSHIRPDITCAVSVVSEFMHSPRECHMDIVQGILRYLKAIPRKGLLFKKNDDILVEAYIDVDWTGSKKD